MPLESKITRLLLERGWKVTSAESCTGGLVAGTLINADGISACYNEGFITYSNEAKSKHLGVSEETLRLHGAVSEETAREMAQGVAKVTESDASIVTTGIAGPGGGTEEKPVGLVYIGCYVRGNVQVERHVFDGDRQQVRHAAVQKALELLYDCLMEAEKN